MRTSIFPYSACSKDQQQTHTANSCQPISQSLISQLKGWMICNISNTLSRCYSNVMLSWNRNAESKALIGGFRRRFINKSSPCGLRDLETRGLNDCHCFTHMTDKIMVIENFVSFLMILLRSAICLLILISVPISIGFSLFFPLSLWVRISFE